MSGCGQMLVNAAEALRPLDVDAVMNTAEAIELEAELMNAARDHDFNGICVTPGCGRERQYEEPFGWECCCKEGSFSNCQHHSERCDRDERIRKKREGEIIRSIVTKAVAEEEAVRAWLSKKQNLLQKKVWNAWRVCALPVEAIDVAVLREESVRVITEMGAATGAVPRTKQTSDERIRKDSEENDDGRDTGENEEADASHLEPAKKNRKIQEHDGVDDPEI